MQAARGLPHGAGGSRRLWIAAFAATTLILTTFPFATSAVAQDATPPSGQAITGRVFARDFAATTSFTVSWTATDDTGVQSYDVRYRVAAPRSSAFAPYSELESATSATSTMFEGAPGSTYCFAVRARDAAGNVSSYSSDECVSVALDDKALRASGFTRRPVPGAYGGGVAVAARKGATLTIPNVRIARVALLAATAPRGGSVKIMAGSKTLDQVSLRSATVKAPHFLDVDVGAARRGTLKIVTTSSAPVVVDGLGIAPAPNVTVTGTVRFDDGSPVAGAVVSAAVTEPDAPTPSVARTRARLATRAARAAARPARTSLRTDARLAAGPSAVTAADGSFRLVAGPRFLPGRVLVLVTYEDPTGLRLESSRWSVARARVLRLRPILLPSLDGAEVSLTGGDGATPDGSLQVEGLPNAVESMYGRVYDPSVDPQAFPGEFAEGGAIPLNSSGFNWLQALDQSGDPITDLGQPATVKTLLPRSQWVDLEDLNPGTDRIEIPIYTFDESTQLWEEQANGWLEDAAGAVLPEDAQPVILDGTFEGEIFSVFETDHFSYMNVDYSYIYTWTLSRLDRAKRNVDCFYSAVRLAETIAKSRTGSDAYAKVNKPGKTLEGEYLTGGAPDPTKETPEIKTRALDWERADPADNTISTTNGEYWGRVVDQTPVGNTTQRKDEFFVNERLWDLCGADSTAVQKKAGTLMMASTLLHEFAHQKQHVKKGEPEPAGVEVGKRLEKDLFGGDLHYWSSKGLVLDGTAVTEAQMDTWLDPATWNRAANAPAPTPRSRLAASGLAVTLDVPAAAFDLFESIPVEVTLTNEGSSPFAVLDTFQGVYYPISFAITDATGKSVRYQGPILDTAFAEESLTTLQPGESRTMTIDLLYDEEGHAFRWDLFREGTYTIKAFYSDFLPPYTKAQSAGTTFSVGAGTTGVAGQVTNAVDNQPVAGATVRALRNGTTLNSATTGADGSYRLPLPAGTFDLEIRADGFLRTTREDVTVVHGAFTTANMSLSPLLTQGEIRLVLTWGEVPRDLDSHLWLPPTTPFHVYYSQRGSADACPFAILDVDDTSGFGPETITITELEEGPYVYGVYNFTGSPDFGSSGAQVQVFDSSGLLTTITPAGATGRWWTPLRINGLTGAVTEVNTLGDVSPEPYTVGSGC